MNYTLQEGVNDRPERVRSNLLRALPIVIATAIAVIGAFTQANISGSDSNNQDPLAIYTASATDFGSPSNPQGNGNNPGSNGTGPGTTTAPKPQSTLSYSSTPNTTLLPVGGLGGEDSSCICQQLQETVSTPLTTVAGALPPVTSPTLP